MATKRELTKQILELTENDEAIKKLKDNYHYLKFLGLDFKMNNLKYSMAVDFNKFQKIEYIWVLQEVKKALA